MAFTLTNISRAREMVAQAQNKVERAQTTMAKIREKAESAIATGIQIAEVSGTSFAFGYANGRWGENGELAFGGVPVDLGAAVVLHGVSFLGGFGRYAEHGHNIGTGALAACGYRTGAQIGAAAANRYHGQALAHAGAQTPPWLLPPPVNSPPVPPQAVAPQPQVPQSFLPPNFMIPTPNR